MAFFMTKYESQCIQTLEEDYKTIRKLLFLNFHFSSKIHSHGFILIFNSYLHHYRINEISIVANRFSLKLYIIHSKTDTSHYKKKTYTFA